MGIPVRRTALWRAIAVLDRVVGSPDTARQVRAASERRARLGALPGAHLVTGRRHRDTRVVSSEATLPDGTVLPLRVYRPRGTAGDVLPVVVHFHGGGWIGGDTHQSDWWCSSLSARAGVVVVSVAYRLAPEHPFPVPVEDCYAATAWVAASASDLGVDAGRLAVMGESSGANLAAAVCLMARDRGAPQIVMQVLLYPSVELVDRFASEDENAHGPGLRRADLRRFSRLYLDGADGTAPYASPLRATHDRLPRALIQTAQHDPLRDQGAAYARALRAAGVEVRLTNYIDAVHGYVAIPGIVASARQALAEAIAELHDALAVRTE